MTVLGLTGGIGTGKSTVSRYLESKGFEIIDADQISREIVQPGSPLLTRISDTFGRQFVKNGILQRKELGAFVFESPERKSMLDDIMMGTIIAIIEERVRSAGGNCIIDAPLLFEVGLDRLCDAVFVVDADTEVRIARVMKRDGISRQEVMDRISNQMGREEKLARADAVLDNSTDKEALYRQIDEAMEKYV